MIKFSVDFIIIELYFCLFFHLFMLIVCWL